MGEEFVFSYEMIYNALKANGYQLLWADNNWVHKSSDDPDHSGMSTETAFKTLLRDYNLI